MLRKRPPDDPITEGRLTNGAEGKSGNPWPWIGIVVSSLINVALIGVVYLQIRSQEGLADRVWGAELIKTIYDTRVLGDGTRELEANIRSREESLKAYLALERHYDRMPHLRKVDLSEMVLPRVDFSGVELPGAKFVRADLDGCIFRDTELNKASFNGATLTGDVKFIDAELMGVTFTGAEMVGVDFMRVDMTDAVLGDCGERPFDPGEGVDQVPGRTNLRKTTFSEVDLDGAVFCGTDLHGADLSGVRNLSQEQLEKAKGDRNTEIPPYLIRPQSWRSN